MCVRRRASRRLRSGKARLRPRTVDVSDGVKPRARIRLASGCGGIGRRARFRSVWGKPRGGSSPLIRIRQSVRATLGQAEVRTGQNSRRLQGFRCRRRRVTVAGADPREGTLGRLCHRNRAARHCGTAWPPRPRARSHGSAPGLAPTTHVPRPGFADTRGLPVRPLDGLPGWRPCRVTAPRRRVPPPACAARRPLTTCPRLKACERSGAACRRCLLKACELRPGAV